jgi:hypothetical protein
VAVPVWQANTAYSAGARVSPNPADGTNWYANVGGTSGGSQPVWPTVAPWTVTDGGVTWYRATSFRQNVRSGLLAALQTFQAANPTLLRQIAAARPRSISNTSLPTAYIGPLPEAIAQGGQVRGRKLSGSVVVVDVVPDNVEAEGRMDACVDGIVDALTLAYHAPGAPALFTLTGVEETPWDEGGQYLANTVTFEAWLGEGRQ